MKAPSVLNHALGTLVPGSPVTSGRLTLLPLTCTRPGKTKYVLLAMALRRGRLTVTEVSDGGSVPYLKAMNEGPWPVLIFDGEELVGAKQNRVVNTTILVGVGETILPVSCVEQGRWSARSRAFASADWTSAPRLRREKERQVSASLASAPEAGPGQADRAARYRADQGAVWREVAEHSMELGVASPTGAMADAYTRKADDLDTLLAAFTGEDGGVPAKGMVGVAVFLDGAFLCLDALWSVRRFREIYPKLLRGYAMEALRAPGDKWATTAGSAPTAQPGDPEAEVLRLFAELTAASPLARPGVDLGTDLRLETKRAVAAGLAFKDDMLQLSVFPR